jgi:hypothetical protein
MNKEVIIEFIKKNLISLICGVVALVAVITTFYPLSGMWDQLHTDADKRAEKYKSLDTLRNKKFSLPPVDPSKAKSDSMTLFPTAIVNSAGKKAIATLTERSQSLVAEAVKLNDHTDRLLVNNLLPPPDAQHPDRHLEDKLYRFAIRYTQVLSPLPTVTGIAGGKIPADKMLLGEDKDQPGELVEKPALNIYNDILHGGVPPSPEDVTSARNTLRKQYDIKYQYRGNEVIPEVKLRVDHDYEVEAKLVAEELKNDVAGTKKMYVDPKALLANEDIKADTAPTFESVWYAQMSLWIQQDICGALANANADSKNVLDARVKHLLSLRLPPAPGPTSMGESFYLLAPAAAGPGGGGTPGEGEKPSPIGEDGVLPKAFNVSPTGRASNAFYDVVPFRLVIDVDATQVPEVIRILSNNKLITITNQDMHTLDNTLEATRGYVYGSNPVVRLSLQGEALYLRGWTTKLMPETIKMKLGVKMSPQGGQNR